MDGESRPCPLTYWLDKTGFRELASGQHGELEVGPVAAKLNHLLPANRLDHVVDVARGATGMGPEAVVDLVGAHQDGGNG